MITPALSQLFLISLQTLRTCVLDLAAIIQRGA
jgi:hypothetical protein